MGKSWMMFMGFLCILVYCLGGCPIDFDSLGRGVVLRRSELGNGFLLMLSVEDET